MAKVHCAHYFSKMKVKCQVHSNFFSITNPIIHLEYSFLILWTLWKGLPAAEKVTYPVQIAQQIRQWAPGIHYSWSLRAPSRLWLALPLILPFLEHNPKDLKWRLVPTISTSFAIILVTHVHELVGIFHYSLGLLLCPREVHLSTCLSFMSWLHFRFLSGLQKLLLTLMPYQGSNQIESEGLILAPILILPSI